MKLAEGNPVTAANEPVLRKYMPELDVLRGLAILLVVLYHGLYWSGMVPRTHGIGRYFAEASVFGWLGVNLFFVLSGFLITGILIDTKKRDDYYHRFYWRRVLRILPIYLITIALLITFHYISWRYVGVSLLFLTNYAIAFHAGLGYGPFWSLAVEEQFYLVWPTIVRHVSIRALTWIAIGFCVIDPVLRWMSATHLIPLTNVHINTLLIADNLACGALAAVFVRSRHGTTAKAFWAGGLLIFVGLAMEIAGIPFGIVHRANPFGEALQNTPWNILFTGILLLSLSTKGKFANLAWAAPLRFLGYISYGLYLIHPLVFIGLYDHTVLVLHQANGPLGSPYIRLLLAGGISVALAWVSRKYFEDRFLRIKVERGDKKRVLLRQAP